jgi:hypothetical protein
MSFRFCRPAVAAIAAAAVSWGWAGPAHADLLPNVQNLNFTSYSGPSPKGSFTSVNPTGWVGGGGLIFIDSNDFANSAAGPVYLTTYGNPGNLPGNYVEADGNPDYEGSFSQTISGLVAGTTYTLSFYQGGSQQLGFANGLATTEQWIVSLATVGLSVSHNTGPVDPVYGQTSSYYSTDPNASIAASPLMTTPSGGTTPWQYVSVQLTAHASTELLSFLAWGDNGSTINLPPIVFLSNTNAPPGLVPEPVSMSLFGVGLVGLGAAMRRRRAKAKLGA